MSCLLLVLASIIFGYMYLTDATRVRSMASAYLSDLLGGEVTIGKANLSVFEGLRLDDVTLRVDKTNKPDSIIFHAQTFMIRYHPTQLLAGKLAATQIIAIEPVVLLVEDSQTHHWNYQRLWQGRGLAGRRRTSGAGPLVLPQIILRDAEVAYLELHQDNVVPVGWYSIEGSLNPNDEEPDRYDFQLQSRGRESLGPSVDGTIRTQGGVSVARLKNFTFGPDIKTMLFSQPRQWCEWHQLQGRIDVPEMVYNPNPSGNAPQFRAELELSNVEMALHPQEWMSHEQNKRVEFFHHLLNTAQSRHWLSPMLVQTLRRLSTPDPIHFGQVSGSMIFTEKGIELKDITGKVENNWFNVNGQIDGYSPDAPARLTISSVSGEDLEIPELTPDYLGSLPKDIQDVMEKLHPHGTCSMRLVLQRSTPGGTVDVGGQIDIHDGKFSFAEFPYPVSHVRGEVLIGYDPIAKMTGVRLLNVQGHGPDNGPDASALLTMSGFIGPLTGQAGVSVQLHGSGIVLDPVLRGALPPPANEALELFDPDNTGQYPKARGSFSCDISRAIGPSKPFFVSTDVDIDDAEGKLTAFPYPMKHLSGRLEIREGYLNIVDCHAQRGDSRIDINGIVRWKSKDAAPTNHPYGPDLQVTVQNLPIDENLIGAMPQQQQAWARKAGISGRLDVAGHVFPIPGSSRGLNVRYVFDGSLRDGALRPGGGEAAMSGLTGRLKLTPTSLELSDLSGARGQSSVAGHVRIDWSGSAPKIVVSASARNLELVPSLYDMLPAAGQDGWNAVKPRGTIDAKLEYSATIGQPPDRLQLRITPRELTVTPAAVPYRLDRLQGQVSVDPQRVVFDHLTAKHGKAQISISGQGDLGSNPVWSLKLSAHHLPVDDELLSALPDSLGGVLKGLQVRGDIGVDLSKLSYWPRGQAGATGAPATHGDSASATAGADVDFAARITMQGSTMNLGVGATDVQGTMDLAGLVRNGRLHRLAGEGEADSLLLAGRPASDLKITLSKNSDDPVIQIPHVEGSFASGDVAGDGDYIYPDTGPSRYDINLVLRDADVQQLTAPEHKDMHGRLTASLQLSGDWDDPESRRGHGDVSVVGEKLYNIPVMLGLMQITNLALPVSSPFSEISTRYTLDGERVVFDKIELRSKDLTMSGSGELNFAMKNVSLWLVTTNPALVALPVIGPLVGGADEELLRIHVTGAIERPKVSASTFDTITTTVDQVFKGNN